MTASDDQLRQEVSELTDLLRNDDSFADVRAVLAKKGLSASGVILAGFLESVDERTHGVIITQGDACIQFECERTGTLSRWEVVENPEDVTYKFEALPMGIAMKQRGEIS
jgi:hypothetical protein